MLLINLLNDRTLTHQYYLGAAQGALAMLDLSSNWTGEQIPRLERLAETVAIAMNLPAAVRRNVLAGACLHDIGKGGVDKTILDKAGPLDDAERTHMMKHPELGYRVLRQLRFPESVAIIALHHHERWDGGGYPDGWKGTAIPLAAQIITVVDAFDAMVSVRPYKPARTYEDAITELRRCSSSQFAPAVVRAFCAIPPQNLIGYEDIAWQ